MMWVNPRRTIQYEIVLLEYRSPRIWYFPVTETIKFGALSPWVITGMNHQAQGEYVLYVPWSSANPKMMWCSFYGSVKRKNDGILGQLRWECFVMVMSISTALGIIYIQTYREKRYIYINTFIYIYIYENVDIDIDVYIISLYNIYIYIYMCVYY